MAKTISEIFEIEQEIGVCSICDHKKKVITNIPDPWDKENKDFCETCYYFRYMSK